MRARACIQKVLGRRIIEREYRTSHANRDRVRTLTMSREREFVEAHQSALLPADLTCHHDATAIIIAYYAAVTTQSQCFECARTRSSSLYVDLDVVTSPPLGDRAVARMWWLV